MAPAAEAACNWLQVLQPAIELAENGFPVAPMAAAQWVRGLPIIKQAGTWRSPNLPRFDAQA